MKLGVDAHSLKNEPWAGKEYALATMLTMLEEKGFDLVIYVTSPLPSDLKAKLPRAKEVIISGPKLFWPLLISHRLKKDGAEHFFAPTTFFAAAFQNACPQTIVIHDLITILPGASRNHRLLIRMKERLLLGRAARRSRRVIALSQNTKDDIGRFFPDCLPKTEVVYLSSHLEGFPAQMKKEPLVLSVGTIEPRKNLELLIRAFEALKAEVPSVPWRLAIVGKIGWKSKKIIEAVAASPFKSDIHLTGYIGEEELRHFYSKALCLVYPSVYEGFGLPLLEAMNAGCPAIAMRNSSLKEVLGPDGTYIGDEKGIVDEVRKLWSDEKYREDLMNYAKGRADLFGREKMAEGLAAAIKR